MHGRAPVGGRRPVCEGTGRRIPHAQSEAQKVPEPRCGTGRLPARSRTLALPRACPRDGPVPLPRSVDARGGCLALLCRNRADVEDL